MISFLAKSAYAQGAWIPNKCYRDVTVSGQTIRVATLQGFECIFQNLLSVLTTLAGVAFGVMIVIGGFRLIFSGGDKQQIQGAQRVITAAVIGLALMIVAWFILLIIQTFTGIQVTQFTIPGP